MSNSVLSPVRATLSLWCLLASLAAPVSVWAQSAPDQPPAAATLRLGALEVNPRLNLSNVGIDTNIFNASDHPQQDATLTLVPSADAWLRVGRAQLASKSSLEWLYFQKTTTQRSVGYSQAGRADLPLGVLTPHVSMGYEATHQRPNDEIDVRVLRTIISESGGTLVQLGPRTAVDVEASKSRIDYDDVEYLGADLRQQLNHESTEAHVSLRQDMTALTTFVVKSDARQDHFEFSPIRNTDSWSLVPGFEFKPLALISGTAFVGYRRFNPTSTSLPGFSGMVAAVDVSYVAREMTRVAVKVDRTLDYSFDVTTPYFVSTGGKGTVTQLLGGNWDAVGRLGQAVLDYRTLVAPDGTATLGRRDRVINIGSGVGYHLGPGARVGLDVTYAKRLSNIAERRYEGVRLGGSFSYGF